MTVVAQYKNRDYLVSIIRDGNQWTWRAESNRGDMLTPRQPFQQYEDAVDHAASALSWNPVDSNEVHNAKEAC